MWASSLMYEETRLGMMSIKWSLATCQGFNNLAGGSLTDWLPNNLLALKLDWLDYRFRLDLATGLDLFWIFSF